MYARSFSTEQLAAVSSLAVRSHAHGFNLSLLFFGCYCLLIGYLIFRSGYLPRTIGVLMQIAGLSYLVNTLAMILAPRFAGQLVPAILLPALVGESSVCLWLLGKGVAVERWRARAAATAVARTRGTTATSAGTDRGSCGSRAAPRRGL
jgi:hypothetical protein